MLLSRRILLSCPVCARSSCTNLIDTQLHSTMRLMPATHTALMLITMLHRLLYVIQQQLTIFCKSRKPIQTGLCMLMSLSIHVHGLYLDASMRRHDICQHNYAVDRRLVVGFCAQPHHYYRTYYPTARFPSPSSYIVSDEPFLDRSRPMSC